MTSVQVCGIDAVVGIGDPVPLRGYALTGLAIRPAQTPAQVRAAWDALPAGTELVVLTPEAAAILGDRTTDPAAPLIAVLPDDPTPMTSDGPA